jgi:hypothetical protein
MLSPEFAMRLLLFRFQEDSPLMNEPLLFVTLPTEEEPTVLVVTVKTSRAVGR